MKRRCLVLCMAAAVLCCLPALAEYAAMPDIIPISQPGTPEAAQGETPESEATPVPETTPFLWSYPISREILDDPSDLLRLVNAENILDQSYPPHALMDTTARKTSGGERLMREVANGALVRMFDAAALDGVELYVKAAYRSYATQAMLYSNRLKSNDGREDGYEQKAGASDHQTGLAVDVVSLSYRDAALTAAFGDTVEGCWLADHCARFGFIIRYPEGKAFVTGINYEPWHLRYVGVEVATYMTENGLTLEEFTKECRQYIAEFDAQTNRNTQSAEDSMTF